VTVQERVEKIRKAFAEFDELQLRLGRFGAWDSEPCGVFRGCVLGALQGMEPERVPTTGVRWQLFTESMGCESAARSLAAKTRKIVRLVGSTPTRDRQKIKSLVHDLIGY